MGPVSKRVQMTLCRGKLTITPTRDAAPGIGHHHIPGERKDDSYTHGSGGVKSACPSAGVEAVNIAPLRRVEVW